MDALLAYLIKNTHLPKSGVKHTLQLLEEGATLPFIARYRKERTGNLDEVQLSEILQFKEQFESLSKRRESILKSLEEQNQLDDFLKNKINATESLVELEDLYLPFKKSRKTKASVARENGLEPLAKIIMAQNREMSHATLHQLAKKYINQSIKNSEDALEGARNIIAEWINERADIRNMLRKEIQRRAVITTRVVKKNQEEKEAQKFADYFEWEESLHRIPSHRLLAILRGVSEGFIRLKIESDDPKLLGIIERKVLKSNGEVAEQIQMAIEDSYKRLLYPSLSNEAIGQAKERADEEAIGVFAKNLKQLLLGSPLGEKSVLAIDPGFRTGCKLVCLDAQGKFLHNETIYPHPPQRETEKARQTIKRLVEAYNLEAIAIGNGTASRETERLVREIRFASKIEIFVVSEAGASIYSASPIAREEFPDQDVTVRGAISIGRRLQDPLAELVKIDPKSIGVGQYQHDVDQSQLKKSLDAVVEHCVNRVGVNINTASVPLLSYVSGIGPKLAENIIALREEKGGFSNRNELLEVQRLGTKAFEQSAGFLRIRKGENPLDNSAVHPESYGIVEKMAKDLGISVGKLIGNKEKIRQIKPSNYVTEKVGLPTLNDIISELEKPDLDVREKAKEFSFSPHLTSIEDLKSGQILPGIVNNITNFGCFVDLGIKESGLIHISNLSNSFVKDVNDHVHLHQAVEVEVLQVDLDRKRIQLKLRKTLA